MAKKLNWTLAVVLVLFPASVFAQEPFWAGYRPVVSASFGYSYLSIPITSSTGAYLNGVGASVTADFRPRLGVKADLNYARASNVLGAGYRSDVLSYMLGPVFYPVSTNRLTAYVQALAGYSRVNSVVQNGASGFVGASAVAPSWAFGMGIERSISPALAIRTEADFLRTSFVDANGAFIGQNDLRMTASLVYHWGRRPGRRNHGLR